MLDAKKEILNNAFQKIAHLALVLIMIAANIPAAYANRVALVIGNYSYADKPLRNPKNDATDMAAALRTMGFDVMERQNRNSDQLRGNAPNLSHAITCRHTVREVLRCFLAVE